jgi:hypothetical protein
MLAKLSRFHGMSHRHAAPLKAAYCNDNRPIRRLAGVSRAQRHALVCGWRRVPATGRLECFWQVDTAAAEEPGISWTMTRRPPGNYSAGKSPVQSAAA